MTNTEIFLREMAEILQAKDRPLPAAFELTSENWDSAALLATIALIDEVFGITVPAKKLAECRCMGEVLSLVLASNPPNSASS